MQAGTLGKPARRLFVLRFMVRRICLARSCWSGGTQTVSVAGHAAFDGLAWVLPEVEPVGDLRGNRRSEPGPFRVRPGAIPAHDLDPGMRCQPAGQRLSVAAGQQLQRSAGLAIDQHGAVVMAASQREVVYSQYFRCHGGRIRQRHGQPKQRGHAGRSGQRADQQRPGSPCQRRRDPLQHRPQQRCPAPVPHGHPIDLLGKGLDRTLHTVTEPAAHPPPDHQLSATNRRVRQPAHVSTRCAPSPTTAHMAPANLCPSCSGQATPGRTPPPTTSR
ncbi:hypothetical protein SAMN04488564_1011020 [Lentzea waywayandensis]|uniref:Uncharacterized protein n=1 Tax=Lentzea waywayandensis TaxID=84724 RepID=A0A1I6D433_9PSEU|nr:hypothetical protein SAMN04488564_1011020 [Lentzea waywayandensis]